VQRLDAAVHHLREAGEVVDGADVEAGLAQLAGGAAGRDELDAERGEALGEVDDPALVGDRQQGPADLDVAGVGQRGGCGVGGDAGSVSGVPARASSRSVESG
jgi:hypothetical protein